MNDTPGALASKDRTGHFDVLKARIADQSAKIAIIGMGYVGLPLARTVTLRGYQVRGFDIDQGKIQALNAKKSPIRSVSEEDIVRIRENDRFVATRDFNLLRDADVIIVCVPTPLTENREPDISYISNTSNTIAEHLKPGQMIVLESTTYPGTTREVIKPVLERKGLVSGRDFFLAYSSEREDPGNPKFATGDIPRVVGADGPDAQELACNLYGKFVPYVFPVSTLEAAEAVKLTENIFRAVNIGLMNELKIVFGEMGVSIWEVIEAAKTKPFGFMPFYPGPGLGGHCIPIDPFYLTWKSREFDIPTRFIELAGEINSQAPRHVISKLGRVLSDKEKQSINGARILVLGLGYKKNVDDLRESPSLKIVTMLQEMGAEVSYYDPFVPAVPHTRQYPNLDGMQSITWESKALGDYHAVLICTDHDDVDYDTLVASARWVVDTRNATRDVTANREKIILA